jgi:hypothetical protein
LRTATAQRSADELLRNTEPVRVVYEKNIFAWYRLRHESFTCTGYRRSQDLSESAIESLRISAQATLTSTSCSIVD